LGVNFKSLLPVVSVWLGYLPQHTRLLARGCRWWRGICFLGPSVPVNADAWGYISARVGLQAPWWSYRDFAGPENFSFCHPFGVNWTYGFAEGVFFGYSTILQIIYNKGPVSSSSPSEALIWKAARFQALDGPIVGHGVH
jgi:hypothetical protein